MDNLYLASIEADITTIEIEQINVNEAYSIAIKLLEDEDTAIATLESSEIIPLHPSLEIDMSSIKEGFKKAIKKIIEFFQWLGKTVVNFFKKIIDMFKNILGIGRKERLEKEIKETTEKAKKLHETIAAEAKTEIDQMLKNIDDEIIKQKKKDFKEYGKKIPVIFIGRSKVDPDTIPEFTTRFFHQIDSVLKYTNTYSNISRQIIIDLGLLLNKICGLSINASDKNLEEIIKNKGMDILQEFNKNVKNISDSIKPFINEAKILKEYNDKYFKLVKEYLNIKEEYDTYIVLGNKVIIFKHAIDDNKINHIVTETNKITTLDVNNFVKLLKLIGEYYDLIINNYIALNYIVYDIPPVEGNKVEEMVDGLLVSGDTMLQALLAISEVNDDKLIKTLNNSNHIDNILKDLKNDEEYIKKISSEVSKALSILLEKANKLEDTSFNGVLQRDIVLSKELSKATTAMIKNIGHLGMIVNDIINSGQTTIKLMNELLVYYGEIKNSIKK